MTRRKVTLDVFKFDVIDRLTQYLGSLLLIARFLFAQVLLNNGHLTGKEFLIALKLSKIDLLSLPLSFFIP